jgi:hypothetical protein
MIHTIISWDCCFRNFFHLTGALAEQQYSKDQYELIYVEQRSRQASDAYNHKLGLQSLQDTVDAYRDRFNVRGLFLSQDQSGGKPSVVTTRTVFGVRGFLGLVGMQIHAWKFTVAAEVYLCPNTFACIHTTLRVLTVKQIWRLWCCPSSCN